MPSTIRDSARAALIHINGFEESVWSRRRAARNLMRLERSTAADEARERMMRMLSGVALVLASISLPVMVAAQTVDVAAAEALMKKSGCMKCHSVSAKKEGPPFKETAAKYKGKPDAEAALVKHLTTSPKIKVDGKEELHDALKTKNEAEIKNVVAYILSR